MNSPAPGSPSVAMSVPLGCLTSFTTPAIARSSRFEHAENSGTRFSHSVKTVLPAMVRSLGSGAGASYSNSGRDLMRARYRHISSASTARRGGLGFTVCRRVGSPASS